VELFSLLWTAFGWRRGIVIVRQGESGALKIVVPPSPYIAEASQRHVEDMSSGIQLVCHRNGRHVITYRAAWDKTVKDAGLTHFRMYNIRHAAATSATSMLAAGADLTAVSAQLGHSTVTITGNVYAHIPAGSQQRAAAIMSSLGDRI
jgi:integrase